MPPFSGRSLSNLVEIVWNYAEFVYVAITPCNPERSRLVDSDCISIVVSHTITGSSKQKSRRSDRENRDQFEPGPTFEGSCYDLKVEEKLLVYKDVLQNLAYDSMVHYAAKYAGTTFQIIQSHLG